jgi:hypothetical protein
MIRAADSGSTILMVRMRLFGFGGLGFVVKCGMRQRISSWRSKLLSLWLSLSPPIACVYKLLGEWLIGTGVIMMMQESLSEES